MSGDSTIKLRSSDGNSFTTSLKCVKVIIKINLFALSDLIKIFNLLLSRCVGH